MDSTTSPVTDPFVALVNWIEQQLDEPLTLERVAARAGLSPYHFSRLFTARMGRSVMAHVRARRLVRGARRLCEERDLKLVELAFDCGFESQEAFTRAFKRVFGVSPGRLRTGFAVEPIEGQTPMTVPTALATPVVQLAELVTLPPLRVAGPARRFDEATKSEIPALPAATYAVYRITLDGSALHPQVKRAMAAIWGELIPASGLKVADGPDFELYDGRFDPQKAGSVIDFHVPVQA